MYVQPSGNLAHLDLWVVLVINWSVQKYIPPTFPSSLLMEFYAWFIQFLHFGFEFSLQCQAGRLWQGLFFCNINVGSILPFQQMAGRLC